MKASLCTAFLLIAMLCASCFTIEPLPIYRIEPLGKEVRWLNGQAFVIEEDSTHSIVIGFYRSEGNRLLFNVEVVNREANMTLVNPAAFYIKTASPHLSPRIPAMNPEALLLSLDVQASREKARYETDQLNDAVWGLTDALVGVVDNASAIGKKESQEETAARRERNLRREERLFWLDVTMEERKANFQTNATSFRNVREFIATNYLRKTSLTKGFRATGIVAFPTMKGSHTFQIILPIGETEYAFWFRQAEIHVELYPANVQSDDLP